MNAEKQRPFVQRSFGVGGSGICAYKRPPSVVLCPSVSFSMMVLRQPHAPKSSSIGGPWPVLLLRAALAATAIAGGIADQEVTAEHPGGGRRFDVFSADRIGSRSNDDVRGADHEVSLLWLFQLIMGLSADDRVNGQLYQQLNDSFMKCKL
jgi:hypothetical protein